MLKDVQASFAHLDTNRDGMLSLEEFTAGLGLLGMHPEFATIIFNAFDKSGDGSIDRREFVAAIGVMLHPEDMERQVRCFPPFSHGTGGA
jgi:Ca2+-binding EF-hand superfamily protein